jgi:histone deacetylase 1/2
MQPVLSDAQLEVILPLSSSSSSSHSKMSSSLSQNALNTQSMQIRLQSGVQKPKQYPDFVGFATSLSSVHESDAPTTFKTAISQSVWQEAKFEEITALQLQGTWSLVPPPPDKNIVGCKWIYKIKKNSDGSISRHKACLVAQGFSQQCGLDYDETFSPVVQHSTVRIILSLAASFHWKLRQLDVKNAFLNGELQEEVYMHQPQGFIDTTHPEYVCKLQKSLYGLKQAPHAWNSKFTSYLPSIGFHMSHSDPSLFIKKTDSHLVILLLYVDDIIITGFDSQMV